MRLPGMGLRGKFVIALLVSAALPFLAGLAVFETSGFRHLLNERGKYHQMEALYLAGSLDQAADGLGEVLQTWLAADPALLEFISAQNRETGKRPPDEVTRETRALDEIWPSLTPGDQRLRAVLANPGADSLRRFGEMHPEVAEVLVTDVRGRLIAATGKSTDFDQADEEWWQHGAALGVNERCADSLRFDSSSQVYSLDVVLPLHREGELAGVVKASLDVSSLFRRLGRSTAGSERWEVVLADGRILASSKAGSTSLMEVVPEQTREMLNRDGGGWFLAHDDKGEAWMTGFTAIGSTTGMPPAHVIFSSHREDVVGPLRRRFLQIGAASAAVLFLCILAGFRLVRRDILHPLSALREAARSVSASAGLHLPDPAGREPAGNEAQTTRSLDKIDRIRTGDEIEFLARDLTVMSRRVLSYQHVLEEEVAAKTSVIHEELELARQFQSALLPAHYPETPPSAASNPLRLKFSHFYQPASTVGGDFFDLIELDENRAGILIADVMGHGARSALVTAILRALVRNHSEDAGSPGVFLADLNRHLHEIIARSGQTLFVTAFFMVLDTRECRVSWAVAGHPAPMRVRRGSGKTPVPLWDKPQHQPALGLVPDAVFQTSESQLRSGDVFLLFTDGASEAENPAGEIFGVDRLAASFDQALDGPMAAMPAKIVCDVSAFQRKQAYEDDVCIVAVEATGIGRQA